MGSSLSTRGLRPRSWYRAGGCLYALINLWEWAFATLQRKNISKNISSLYLIIEICGNYSINHINLPFHLSKEQSIWYFWRTILSSPQQALPAPIATPTAPNIPIITPASVGAIAVWTAVSMSKFKIIIMFFIVCLYYIYIYMLKCICMYVLYVLCIVYTCWNDESVVMILLRGKGGWIYPYREEIKWLWSFTIWFQKFHSLNSLSLSHTLSLSSLSLPHSLHFFFLSSASWSRTSFSYWQGGTSTCSCVSIVELTAGAIAGIVIACVFAVIFCVAVSFWCYRRRRWVSFPVETKEDNSKKGRQEKQYVSGWRFLLITVPPLSPCSVTYVTVANPPSYYQQPVAVATVRSYWKCKFLRARVWAKSFQ